MPRPRGCIGNYSRNPRVWCFLGLHGLHCNQLGTQLTSYNFVERFKGAELFKLFHVLKCSYWVLMPPSGQVPQVSRSRGRTSVQKYSSSGLVHPQHPYASIVPVVLFQMLKHKVDLDMESHDKSTLSLDTAGCLIFTAAFQIPFPRRFRVLFQRPAQPGVATWAIPGPYSGRTAWPIPWSQVIWNWAVLARFPGAKRSNIKSFFWDFRGGATRSKGLCDIFFVFLPGSDSWGAPAIISNLE